MTESGTHRNQSMEGILRPCFWSNGSSAVQPADSWKSRACGLPGWHCAAAWRRILSKRIRFGSFRRTQPVSQQFGFDRGLPIDRYYIESFLAAHSSDICGHVLEIGDDAYSKRFGGDRCTHQDVLHVVPGFTGATMIADLAWAPHRLSFRFCQSTWCAALMTPLGLNRGISMQLSASCLSFGVAALGGIF
jgi:hypothetical protein